MSVPATTVPDWFRATKVGQALLKEEEAGKQAARERLGAQKAAKEAERDREHRERAIPIEKQAAKVIKLEEEFKREARKLGALHGERDEIIARLEREILLIDRQLRDTADPRLDEFRADMLREVDKGRAGEIGDSVRFIEGRGNVVFSNRPGWGRRLDALMAAYREAELLKCTVCDVEAEIARLRASIPEVGAPVEIDYAGRPVDEKW